MFESLNPKLNFFGLDISDTSIKLADIKKRDGEFTLSHFEKENLRSGVIEKGKILNEKMLVSKIEELVDKSNLSRYVAVSLPEENAFFQVVEVPKVKRERMQEAIEYQAEESIPLPVEDIYLDYQVIRSKRNGFDVLLAALPKKVVDSRVLAVKKAGLFPVVAEVESMSAVRSLVKNDDSPESLLLIDIGENKTILTVFSKGVIVFTSYVLVSSKDLTKKIAEDNDISKYKAEKLKIEHGLIDKDRLDIAESLEPLLSEMVEEIEKHLAYYNSCGFKFQNMEGEKLEEIIICGGGAKLKGLPEFLTDKLNLKVRKGDSFVNISDKCRDQIEGDGLEYATSFGLALRNFNKDSF